jgi:glycosyltransferase involved in cell wall biosynthesis
VELSIVIPTLNEVRYLPAAIDSARSRARGGRGPELIVADCGSTDGTAETVEKCGVHLVWSSPPLDCRAAACNAGAAHATGDVLLFLDADSLLPYGYDAAIRRALAEPHVIGGAFEFALAGREWPLRIVEIINRVRYRIWKWYYSDQGLFVRAGIFRRAGGFPLRRIMETSDLCRILWRHGRLTLIPRLLQTSPRRFLAGGVWRVLAEDTLIWGRDLFRLPTEQFSPGYRGDNLRRGGKGDVELFLGK